MSTPTCNSIMLKSISTWRSLKIKRLLSWAPRSPHTSIQSQRFSPTEDFDHGIRRRGHTRVQVEEGEQAEFCKALKEVIWAGFRMA
jgi:hypothetical protein